LSETVAQLVVMEMKVKRDQRIDSPWPRKHRKSKCFLILKFFAAKSRRGDFSQQSIAHCKDSQMLVARHGRHQVRSVVFAHNVPAMTDQQSPKTLLRADRAPHQRR
jgi:hypothetical protein